VLQKLPFLINLTADERKSIFKAGPDSLSFVTNAFTAAQKATSRTRSTTVQMSRVTDILGGVHFLN
jgi:hypothetical protein